MNRVKPAIAWIVALYILAVSASLPAQSTTVDTGTTPQSAPMNADERKNLDFVLNWWREVIEARHTELAEKYQAEGYIQHNPNVPTGRAAFVKFFNTLGPAINPIPDTLRRAPVMSGAKGDFVWLVFEDEVQDPHDASKTIHPNSFDLLRIQNGKVQEHWDSARKFPGSAAFVPSTAPAPTKWSVGETTAEEQRNLVVAAEFSKDILQYGHVELGSKIVAPDFIEHNPGAPRDRDGFLAYIGRMPDRAPQPIKPEWKKAPVWMTADGPYVVMMWSHEDQDPSDASKNYTRNYFDILRIQDGLVREDWN